jgi:Cu/Zn superoxide dismutase
MRATLTRGLLGLVLTAAVVSPSGAQAMQGDVTATLNASNDSGVNGEAVIHPMGDTTMIMITVQGLEPNSRHAAHIHNGACSAGILMPLEVVVADANGTGTSTSTVSAAPDASWWIQVHRAESPPGPGITCGQVPTS